MLDAQSAPARETTPPAGGHWYSRFDNPYLPDHVRAPSFTNSARLNSLIRGGKLYLSLDDAIALAIENNLDVELERYAFPTADSDLLRAKGGSTVRGLPLVVDLLPEGVGGPQSPLLNLPASGTISSTTVPTTLVELSAIIPGQESPSVTTGSPSLGSPLPQYDPSLTGGVNAQRSSTPEENALSAGVPVYTNNSTSGNIGYAQGFSTGTSVTAGFTSLALSSNGSNGTYNPYVASSLGLTITQPLLRGFSPSVNRRFIRIAKNNQRASDQLFRQQAIETVTGVIQLYDDLVSLLDDVGVKRETLASAQRLYEDNRAKVEQGTLAPVELVRAQAQVAAAQQDLANSDGFARQQELILKSVISRTGTSDPMLREARVVPTTPLEISPNADTTPVQDYINMAFANRPELAGGRIQIENTQIAIEGTRNEMLPQFDLVGTVQSNGFAGQANSLNPATSIMGAANPVDPALLGGFGSSLEQILAHNYPTYAVGIQLNLPLRNRVAEADYIRDETQLRQSQVLLQRLQNQVRLEVEGAILAMQRTRAAYAAAVEARKLQEQSLEIENEKFENGLSTTFLVLQYQSFVAQSRSTEVAARGAYIKARTALERATGRTLELHNISFEEAQSGTVKRAPSPIPANPAPGTLATPR